MRKNGEFVVVASLMMMMKLIPPGFQLEGTNYITSFASFGSAIISYKPIHMPLPVLFNTIYDLLYELSWLG